MNAIRGINHVTLSVKDISESFAFYRDFLGLVPVMRSAFSAYFLAGDAWIALVAEPTESHRGATYSHLAFDVAPESMAEWRAKAARDGVREWQDNRTEGDSLYLLDPSGNKLELHCTGLAARVAEGKAHWKNEVEWFR